jgi:alanyl-tRNA synthetase
VPLEEIEQKLESLLTKLSSLEKEIHARDQEQAIESAQTLLSEAVIIGTIPTIVATLPRRNARQLEMVIEILQKRFEGVVLLAGTHEKTVSLMATVSKSFASIIAAQKLIQSIAPLLGGKGGGTPYIARGAGPGIAELSKALNHAKESIAAMSTSQ